MMGATGVPQPGIYSMMGTLHGQRCLIAYDSDGEFRIEVGPSAYLYLVEWLEGRGVSVPAPALRLEPDPVPHS